MGVCDEAFGTAGAGVAGSEGLAASLKGPVSTTVPAAGSK